MRQLVTPRNELRPLYLNTQGYRVGKSGEVLQVKDKEALKQEVRIGEICQVNLMGNVQVSTQAVQTLCEADVPICYFSQGGWFYGITTGMNTKNVFLRQDPIPAGGRRVVRARAGARGWWRGRFAISGRCCSGTILSRRRERWSELKQMADRPSGRGRSTNCWGLKAMRRGFTSANSRA